MHYWGVGLEELLERYVARDDEAAMAELVRQTRGTLLSVARRISNEDAEDAVQTAYLSLAKRGGSGGAPVLAWLLTAVARIAYRAKATRAREHAIAERLAPSAAPPDPPDAAIGKEEAELLRRELWKLPADYRDALQLRYLHGLSGAEVARLLGVNESTVRTRLQRGRLLLRSRLARVMHPFLALPWLLGDAGAAGAVAMGGMMKVKLAIAALLLLALGIFYLGSRDRAPPLRAVPAFTAEEKRVAGAASDGGPVRVVEAAVSNTGAAVTGSGVVVDETGKPVGDVRLLVRAVKPDSAWLDVSGACRGAGAKRAPDDRMWPERIDDAFRARAPQATTDDAGRFALRLALAQRETLVFVKEGHAAYEVGEVRSDMRIILPGVQPLEGRVTDTSGAPIAGATVQILDRPWQDAQTDDDGRYTFLCPPAHAKGIVAWANGYDQELRQAPGDFRLRRIWLIVDVTDAADGRPLANGCARLATADGRPLWSATAARVGGLPPGRCLVAAAGNLFDGGKAVNAVLHVFAPGYQPVFEPVDLNPDDELPHLRVALSAGDGPPALAGRINGAPVAHIVVRNAKYFQVVDYECITDADTAPGGRFLFSGLPRSDYLLIVSAPGCGTVTRRVAPVMDDIEIDLAPAAVLEVLAVDRRGAAVAGTAIHVELPDGMRYWIADTDERGYAVFGDLPAQELHVAAVVEGWNRPIHDKGLAVTATTPAAGTRTRLTVTVPEPLSAVLSVRDAAGKPRGGVTLGFEHRFRGVVAAAGKSESDRLRALRVTTDAEGRAAANLYQGEYSVMCLEGPTPVRVGTLTVGEGNENRTECVVARTVTVVRGRVREHGSSDPVRNAVLRIGDDATARTDAEGRFEVRGLPSRSHSLYLLTLRDEYASGHCEIDLSRRSQIDVDFVAVPKALVSGDLPAEVAVSVRSSAAGPLGGARVSVLARLGDCWIRTGGGGTDTEGRIVVRALEAASYRIWASAEGHETADVTIDSRGARTDVAVDLAAKP